MTAQVVIDDGTNPPVQGSTDNPATFLSVVHTLSNFDNTGVLGHTWTLVDRAIGSSATLSATGTPTTTLTPDIAGSYLVQLETFTDAAKTIADGVSREVIGVRFPGAYDWLVPAAGETDQQSTTRGWAGSREDAIREVRSNLLSKPTSIQAGFFTAGVGDLVLYDPTGGGGPIFAPASPALNDRFAIKNVTIDVTSVVINGNGLNIEDPNTSTFLSSFFLGAALVSIDYLFDGTNWVII